MHGTYAQHAPWLQDGQSLPEAISRVEGTVLDRFCWSGKNRHRRRLEAGDELRSHLVKQIKAYRAAGVGATHYVVAHSHGGNVALYALRDRGDEDDAMMSGVNLITLATPFLAMRERVLPKRLLIALLILFLFGVLAIVSSGSAQGWKAEDLLMSVSIVAPAFMYLLSLFLYRLRPSSPSLWQLVSGKAARREAALITAHALKPPERLLVIGALSDEAAGLLGAAQLTNRIIARFASELRPSNPKVLLGLLFLFALAVISEVLLPVAAAGIFTTMLVWILFASVPLAVFFLVLATLPFGLDSLFWNFNAETTAGASPIGASKVVVVGWRQMHYERAAHGVYENIEAQQAVIARLRALD